MTKALANAHAPTAVASAAAVSSNGAHSETLVALQRINSSFEQLLSFIPPKFYLPQNYPQAAGRKRAAAGLDMELEGFDEYGEGDVQTPQKRSRKETAADKKAEKKRVQREARMAKLDPANHKSVTELQAERAAKAKDSAGKASEANEMDLEVDFDEDDVDEDEGEDDVGAGDTDSEIDDSDEEDDSREAQVARAAVRRQQYEARQKARASGAGGDSDQKSASITDLRIKLQKRIAELQAQRKQPPSSASDGLANGKGSAANDEAGDASMAADGDTSTMSAKSDLLLERRRQRGEMRDRRRRERKEARRREKEEVALAAKGKGKKAANAAGGAGAQAAGGGPAAPGLIVPDGRGKEKATESGVSSSTSPFGVSADTPSFAFNNISFAGPGEEEEELARKKKKSKHALPRDPRSALQVLEARKAKEEKRKAKAVNDAGGASSGAESEAARTQDEDGVVRSQDATKWSKMLEATSGIKIRDDERMLKKAIKKKDKMKEKSKADWTERVRGVADEQAAKAKKRNENIAARKEAKTLKHKGGAASKKATSLKGSGSKKKPSAKARPGFEGKAMGIKKNLANGKGKGKR